VIFETQPSIGLSLRKEIDQRERSDQSAIG